MIKSYYYYYYYYFVLKTLTNSIIVKCSDPSVLIRDDNVMVRSI